MLNSVVKNLIYAISSQGVGLFLGVLRASVIPVYLGVTDFGTWQVYVLYLSFVGFFTYGYNDGIYLKYGAYNESDIDFKLIRTSLIFYMLSGFITILIIALFIGYSELDKNKEIALYAVLPNVLLLSVIAYYSVVFQVTNQIKKFSYYMLVDKVSFVLMLFLILACNILNFLNLILIDIASKVILVFVLFYSHRQYFFGRLETISAGFFTYINSVKVGVNLLFSNVIGILVLTIGRLYVERNFTLEEFAIYSLGIMLTNVALMAVSAISLVAYPAIKRSDESMYGDIYVSISKIYTIGVSLILCFYFIFYFLVFNFMRDYLELLNYLNLLFVICVLQGKMQLLLNTYYKVLRKEVEMLKANITTILLCVVFIALSSILLDSVEGVVLSILLSIAIRVFLSEFYIRGVLNLCRNSILVDFFICFSFLVLTFLKHDYISLFFMIIVLSMTILVYGKNIVGLIKNA